MVNLAIIFAMALFLITKMNYYALIIAMMAILFIKKIKMKNIA